MSPQSRIQVCEVGPRDGLQNEAVTLPLEQKLEFVELLAAARPAALEVTSFVRPDRIPQLADADDLAAALRDRPWRCARAPSGGGVPLAALVPNLRGYERFRASGLDIAAVFMSASEGHSRSNLNAGIERAQENAAQVLDAARADGVETRAYISTAFGCPYEGAVAPEAVLDLVASFAEHGALRVVLGDTIGVAQPAQVQDLCERAAAVLPVARLGLHVHDTYGAALTNVIAGWRAGVRSFDAAAGGTGGCPYAPGAAGNLASEDLVLLFERMGVETGVDLEALVGAGRFLESVLERRLPGKALQALLAGR